jgi:hypothetical protein
MAMVPSLLLLTLLGLVLKPLFALLPLLLLQLLLLLEQLLLL